METTKKPLYQTDNEELWTAAASRETGLTTDEARYRLAAFGRNELRQIARRTPLSMLLDQFRDPMIVLLIAAAIVSGLVGEPQDTIVILVIIILNSIIGFNQEYKAEKAMLALQKMASPWAMVKRNNIISQIPASELVPGDLVILEAGMIVPADIRLLETVSLKIDESTLTGESIPVEKNPLPLAAETLLSDRKNMAHKGSIISYGRGRGIVATTGMATEIGKIASLLDKTEQLKTPLQKRLARVGRNLATAALILCAVVFISGIMRGEDVLLMFLTAVSLAVAAVPEALPAVITICLALGSKQMTQHNVLVRKLAAVETLGSITSICSDKTGTLTENKMTVAEMLDANFQKIASCSSSAAAGSADDHTTLLLLAMALNNDVVKNPQGNTMGDPTEKALFAKAQESGFVKEELLPHYPRVAEIPFSSERQAMTTIHQTVQGDYLVFTKGSVEAVAGMCPLFDMARAQAPLEALAGKALRIIAFAYKRIASLETSGNFAHLEKDLIFLGVTGAMDQPRQEAFAAVQTCIAAGIRPVMITGDHPLTAMTIAKKLGIAKDTDQPMTGLELATLSEDHLIERVAKTQVYARVAPEHKLRLVAALQKRGESIAMTGDGVNDAPALKKADIGIAMGVNGTDVAKEASDIILLDDNFSTIVTAIKEGRKIYDNIRKFFRYTLTSNTGEIWTIFLAPFLGLPIPLLPIHILWINLVTDGAPGLALTTEPAEADIMNRPPRAPDESLFARGMWQQIIWIGMLMGGVCLVTQKIAIANNWHWQTMVFTVLCLSQFGNSLAIRSERTSFFSQGPRTNLSLSLTVVVSVGLQVAIIYTPFLQKIFHTKSLSATELSLSFLLSSIVFFAVECEKLLIRKNVIRY